MAVDSETTPAPSAMRWASALSVAPDAEAAVLEAATEVRAQLGGARPDLAMIFVSTHHAPAFERIPALVARAVDPGALVGCSAGGVIGGTHEIEGRPAVSLIAAVLPNVAVTPFRIAADALPPADAPADTWRALVPAATDNPAALLVCAEPFTFDVETFLGGMDRGFPASRTLGGVASGARSPAASALFFGDAAHRTGLVGVALSGDVDVDTVVAQGCRPIGDPMFVTRADRNLIWELDGQPPLGVLQALYERLDPSDRELARHALLLGVVMNPCRDAYGQGDFLIRNLTGMDAETGVLAVGAMLQENAVVQFHLRDAGTSAADLEILLSRRAANAAPPAGALLFSCLGRGTYLYGRPDHDSEAFRRHFGAVPLGGFFCNGEIGPVQGSTFLHGYTSVFCLFRAASARDRGG